MVDRSRDHWKLKPDVLSLQRCFDLPSNASMTRHYLVLLVALAVGLTTADDALARKKTKRVQTKPARVSAAKQKTLAPAGQAELRLHEVYQLVSQAKVGQALAKAESLVRDHPNFQLAQLVYGDLLAAQMRPIHGFGDVPEPILKVGAPILDELRQESQMRLKAARERPPVDAVPSQFMALSPFNKHAIAVDASRSRLYLFKNDAAGLTLMADYYVSVGKFGLEKSAEGDSRTPLGVYFVTSNLDPKTLKDFYGYGALPINYPNELDARRGKTGRGIWLHGTPPSQFSRAPLATDGCVVLANPDLAQIIRTVEVRSTPVIIAKRLDWIKPSQVRADGKPIEAALAGWRNAKTSGNLPRLLSYYSADFSNRGKTLAQWTPALRSELDKVRGRDIELKNLSLLRWTDSADTIVVTFGEVASGALTGPTKRQYWGRRGDEWKIFYEGVIG